MRVMRVMSYPRRVQSAACWDLLLMLGARLENPEYSCWELWADWLSQFCYGFVGLTIVLTRTGSSPVLIHILDCFKGHWLVPGSHCCKGDLKVWSLNWVENLQELNSRLHCLDWFQLFFFPCPFESGKVHSEIGHRMFGIAFIVCVSNHGDN